MEQIIATLEAWEQGCICEITAMRSILASEASEHEKLTALYRLGALVEIWHSKRR